MSVDVDAGPVGELLKIVAEPLRWRIVELLSGEELCVCHLVEELGVAQPLVSHHLKVLRRAGMVSSDRHRYWTYYRLEPAAFEPIRAALDAVLVTVPVAGEQRRPCC